MRQVMMQICWEYSQEDKWDRGNSLKVNRLNQVQKPCDWGRHLKVKGLKMLLLFVLTLSRATSIYREHGRLCGVFFLQVLSLSETDRMFLWEGSVKTPPAGASFWMLVLRAGWGPFFLAFQINNLKKMQCLSITTSSCLQKWFKTAVATHKLVSLSEILMQEHRYGCQRCCWVTT